MNDYERASRGGGYPDRPGFRARQTSREAAEAIVGAAKSIRARVFEALKASPATPEEVAETLGVPLMNTRPRFSELAARGLIEDSGIRRRAAGGKSAIVWRIKERSNV